MPIFPKKLKCFEKTTLKAVFFKRCERDFIPLMLLKAEFQG